LPGLADYIAGEKLRQEDSAREMADLRCFNLLYQTTQISHLSGRVFLTQFLAGNVIG